MAKYVNVTGTYDFGGELGRIYVLLKPGARYVRARWKGGRLQVTAPPGIDYDELRKMLANMQPRLEQAKPQPMYYIGQKIVTPEVEIEVRSQSHHPDSVGGWLRMPNAVIDVGTEVDLESPGIIKYISQLMCRIATSVAPGALLPLARQVAARVGAAPSSLSISRGHRTLGHCDARGHIALSYALVFYPLELREYVICHELAHLQELNHSPRFHEICNHYCGGREAELEAALRAHKIPIIK